LGLEAKMRTLDAAADFVNKLYHAEFSGKPHGRFRIANTELALLAGRKNIDHSSVVGIQTILFEKYDLLLIDLRDEVAVLKSSILRRYRKASEKVLADVLGVADEFCDTDEDD